MIIGSLSVAVLDNLGAGAGLGPLVLSLARPLVQSAVFHLLDTPLLVSSVNLHFTVRAGGVTRVSLQPYHSRRLLRWQL